MNKANSGIRPQLQLLFHFFFLVIFIGLLVFAIGSYLYDFQVSNLAELLSFIEISSLASIALILLGILYTISLISKKEIALETAFLRQSLFAISLVIVLYVYGQQDRFFSSINPLEDLTDFSFILFLVLTLWAVASLIFKLFKEKYGKLSKPIFLLMRGVTLLSCLIPLDLLFNYLFLDLVYDLPLYEDYWVLEVPFKILILLLVNFSDEIIRIKSETGGKPISIKVKSGNTHRFVDLDQISYFLVKNQITYLYATSGEKFIIDLTLAQLEKKFQNYDFFRANRQLLIARNAVEGYRSSEGKKIELNLSGTEDSSSSYYISRLAAPSFRKWINHELGTIQA